MTSDSISQIPSDSTISRCSLLWRALGPEDLYVMTCIAVVDQLNDLGDSAPMQAPVHTDVIPVEALPNTAVNAFIDAYTESK